MFEGPSVARVVRRPKRGERRRDTSTEHGATVLHTTLYTNRGKHGLKLDILHYYVRIVKNIGDRLTLVQSSQCALSTKLT